MPNNSPNTVSKKRINYYYLKYYIHLDIYTDWKKYKFKSILYGNLIMMYNGNKMYLVRCPK